jgi:hypothetical protein
MAKYHVTRFGSFGGGIPTDMDGYTYTTAREWMSANVDWAGHKPSRRDPYFRDWAEERADTARHAIAAAEDAIMEWRRKG